MIVRNEERNLAACLEPVASQFDQIVIVDTGSQDRTLEIAQEFTSEIYHFAWRDDFSAARNESLRHCQGEWVFWLDADDRIRPEQVVKLRLLLDQLDDRPAAYVMDTVCPPRFECESSRLVSHIRLFRRSPELRWQGRVHEQLRPEPAALGHELIWSDIQIDHLGYLEASLRQRKLQRDIRLLRMDFAVDPEDASTLLHLGLAYSEVCNHVEARKYLQRLLTVDRGPADYMRRVYGVLAELSLRDGKPQDALEVLGRGLFLFPGDNSLLFLRAEALYEVDRFDSARATLNEIVTGPRMRHQQGGVPSEIQRKLAPRKLGDVLRVQGAYAEAETTLEAVVAEFPSDTHSWYSIGRVHIDANQRQKLDAVIPRLKECPQGHIFAALLMATWHLNNHELRPAGDVIDQLISEAPNMPLPRILRADWLARCNAPLESRIAACRDLLRVQPGNADAARSLMELEQAQRRPAETWDAAWGASLVVGAGVPAGVFRA